MGLKKQADQGLEQKAALKILLSEYKEAVERAIEVNLCHFGPSSRLKEACAYALTTGGKRFRPLLVQMMGKALQSPLDLTDAALAVEYFHTASLIADDLPCMDDDDQRRGTPSTHIVFGESTALLASYALIAGGYEAIARSASKGPQALCSLAIENASWNTGVMGATGGQFLDMNPTNLSIEVYDEIIHKKTVSLFELSFVLGWLFGGGDPEKLGLIKKAASHFGRAFQIADDIDDIDQDALNKRAVNLAALVGVAEAKRVVSEELDAFYQVMDLLKVDYSEFKMLGEQLRSPSKN